MRRFFAWIFAGHCAAGPRLLLLLLAGMVPIAASPAAAEMIVLSSTVPALPPGTIVDDGELIELPPGTDLRLIFEGGKIARVEGPFKGRAGDLAPTGGTKKADKAMWERLKSTVKKRRTSSQNAASSRSLASGPSSTAQAGFSWRIVPSHSDGPICVDTAEELMLARPPLGTVNDMTIIDPATETRAVVRWRDGSDVSPWPRLVPASSDKGYLLLVAKLPVREIKLQILDAPLPTGDEALEILFEHGCRFQMEAWIEQELG